MRDEDHQAGVQMGPEMPEKPWHGPGGSEEVNGQSDFVCRPIYRRRGERSLSMRPLPATEPCTSGTGHPYPASE